MMLHKVWKAYDDVLGWKAYDDAAQGMKSL